MVVALHIPPTHARDLDFRDIKIESRVISTFDRGGLGINRNGKLEFLGGLVLSSPDSVFGGWSDISVDPDGKRFLAVSDDGVWMRGQFNYKGRRVVGVSQGRVGRLRALSGRFLKGKREKDAEGLSLVRGTLTNGDLLISFERIHRVGRFKATRQGVIGPSTYLKLPSAAKRLSSNKGLEGVAVFRAGRQKGRVVVIGERRRSGSGDRQAFVLGAKSFGFALKDMGDMDVTSVVALSDGDLLILERRFRWSEGVRMRLRRISSRDIKPGARVGGEVLMTADLTSEIDNMEGLAVHRGRAGETILTLISDDNFNRGLQRTVLLQFLMHEDQKRANRRWRGSARF